MYLRSDEHDEASETADANPPYSVISGNENVVNIKQRRSRIGTRNFQGLCNDRYAFEVGEILHKNCIDIIRGQESLQLDHSKI